MAADAAADGETKAPWESEVSGIFDELRRPLFRYFLCAGLSREDADEGIQETFLRLHQHLRKDGDRANLRGWIFQVARNLARNQHKSARVRRTETLDAGLERRDAFADPGGSPEDLAIRSERMRRLRRSMEMLTPQQRECVLLRASGLRYREIAGVLGVGISSVGEMVQRAAARLSEVL
jgi:RNA polymerase sigma-70 factor (ECF subfamily)